MTDKVKIKNKTKAKNKPKDEQRSFFYMASCNVIFIREDQQRQRDINILVQTATLNITKADLSEMNKLAVSRIVTEHDVAPTDVKDVVFLNLACLGHMTEEEFHGSIQEPTKQ